MEKPNRTAAGGPAGTIVIRAYDDAPLPLTGRVTAQVDENRLEVAWGDEQFADVPRTVTEWFDDLSPYRSADMEAGL
jgi:hypothetical protein